MAVTQKFIAQQAGVSQKTVSLYFQGSPRVADHTREKLRGITERYGYFPNLAARSIKTRRFKRIACAVIQFVTDRNCELQLRHPQLLAYINGAALEMARHGYSLVLEPLLLNNLTQEFITDPELFKSLSVDGIIGLPGSWVPELIDQSINSMGLPAVWLNRNPSTDPARKVACMNIDEEAGAAQLTDYLVARGHRKIAWFGPGIATGEKYHYSARNRYHTFKSALLKHGLEVFREEFPLVGESLIPAAQRLLEGELPDAVVCSHFTYKNAATFAAMARGLVTPRNVELVHFASSWEFNPDTYDCQSFVLLPEMQIGQMGARYLYSCLQGKPDLAMLTPLSGVLHIGTPLFCETGLKP